MTFIRVPGWHSSLTAYLADVARTPFVYGQHDCALFAADAVRVMTGVDLAGTYRGRYSSLSGGMRILRKDGFADHVELVRAHFAAVPTAKAMPGDLACFATVIGRALGVVQSAMVYVLMPNGTLGMVPLTDAVEAFSV